MRYLLGIDNGGTRIKAAVFDQSGREVAVAAEDTPLLIPQPGYQERDMQALWEANARCIREAIRKTGVDADAIAAVGCAGHGKGLYLWGKDDRPVGRGIASTDSRAAAVVARWEADGTVKAAQERTLQPVSACQPVALLAWMKEQEPARFANIRWIFSCKDYIRFRLTGRALAERTDCSGTCLMNLLTREYDRELLRLFGLEELFDCLAPLCRSDEPCGTVTEAAAALTGLKAGTPVCGGMFDIDACAVAMDVTTPDRLCTIAGTWSINEYPAPAPVRADTSTRNSLFCLPDTYLIEESSATSAGNLDWYLATFMKWEKEEAKRESRRFYDEVDRLVDDLPPEDSDVLFLPFLYGTNVDGCDRAAFVGMTNACTQAHMLRAVFEGVVFSHLYHIEKLLAFREPPATVRLAGGAANSAVWTQMFADALGLPIEVVGDKELGAKGAAMAAAVAAGLYADYRAAADAMVGVQRTVYPRMDKHKTYMKKFAAYKHLLKALGGTPCSNN